MQGQCLGFTGTAHRHKNGPYDISIPSQRGCISANWSRSRNLGHPLDFFSIKAEPTTAQGRVPASLQWTTGATRRSREQNIQKSAVVLVEREPSKCVFRVLKFRITTGGQEL
jgi:hypothetical protein